jgi:hypothetical protein
VIGPSRAVFVEEAADGAALIKRIPERAIFQKISQFVPKPDLQGKHENPAFSAGRPTRGRISLHYRYGCAYTSNSVGDSAAQIRKQQLGKSSTRIQ